MVPEAHEFVRHFDGGREQSPGVAAHIDDQTLHPVAVQLPQGFVEFAVGRFLEAGQFQVADPVLAIDDLHVLYAGHVHAAAHDAQAARGAGSVGQDDFHRAAFRPFEHIRRLITADLRNGQAIDLDDPLAVADAGRLGGAAGQDVDDQQRFILRPQLDAQADEIAFNLREHLVQLAAGQEARVLVQGTGGAGGELQDRGRRANSQFLLGQLRYVAGHFAGFPLIAHRRGFHPPLDPLAEHPHRFVRTADLVRLPERSRSQGDVQIVQAALRQFLPGRLLDVIGLDFPQDFGVHLLRVALAQLLDPTSEAGIFVAAAQVVMHTSQRQAVPQFRLVRVIPDRVFVVGQGFAPPLLRFQVVAALQQLRDGGFRRQRFGRNHYLGRHAGRRQSQEDCGREEEE